MARSGLLDVPGHEPRHACAGRALRLDLQPQLRGSARTRRAHPSGLAADGSRCGDRRPFRRHQGLGGGVMKPIEVISGAVSHLDRADVDTDQIMPKQFLKRIERSGFGRYLFYDWAQEPGWDLPANPILVTGENFGCGSSREHAPWGLQDYGFEAIVAPSFADIFYTNCLKIGLLAVAIPDEHCRALAQAGEGEVDLEAQAVRYRDPQRGETVTVGFEIDPETKRRLLLGLDDIGVTLS